MRVGYVMGDLRSGRQSTFPTLVQKMQAIGSVEPIVIYTHGDPTKLSPSLESIKMKDYPLPPHWHRLEHSYDIDLFHLSNIPKWGHIPAYLSETPVVGTARGTAHWCQNIPSESGRADTRYRIEFQSRDRLGKYTLDKIFTVSDHVKDVLSEEAAYRREQLFTTYLGIEDEYYNLKNPDREINTPERFILHVSNQSPIKNVSGIIDAFNVFVNEFPSYNLLIVGRGWKGNMNERCKRYGIVDNVEFLGQISNSNILASLYGQAELYVHNSVHETFGRPTIEAMAMETPVVTSKNCALEEVVNEGAMLVDNPDDPNEISEKISHLLNNPVAKSELISKGRERAEHFRSNKYTKRLEDGYRDVLA